MECIVNDCKNIVVAKSLCSKHYSRSYRYGSVDFVKQNKTGPKECYAIDCHRIAKAKGLCDAHYARFKRNGESFSNSSIRKIKYYTDSDVCIIPKCIQKPHALDLCRTHYSQQKAHKIDFSTILDLFDNGCMVCEKREDLQIDHDHKICNDKFACEKCFRGILCGACNRALGIMTDDVSKLKKMIQYIQK